jgi:N,N-dimethylformamidase beta subunit-like, C-terminal
MIEFNTLSPAVEGYPGQLSYLPGEELTLHCSARSPTFSVEVTRVGARRDVVWRREGIRGFERETPAEAYADGCDWPVSLSLTIPRDWRSGFYEVVFIADGVEGEEATSHACFVLRALAPGRDTGLLLVLATNTYNAYNKWGGACLYTGVNRVSFQRPFERGYVTKPVDGDGYDGRSASIGSAPDPDHRQLQAYLAANKMALWSSSAGWPNWELRFVRWAESNGFVLDYAINRDLEFRPGLLDPYRLVLSVGHDEYWSWGMRDAIDAFVGHGGNHAIFSGNTVYWQVRFEDDGRAMTCHKYIARRTDPVRGTERQHLLTSIWSDPLIGRPENRTTGLSFCRGGYVRFGRGVPRSSGAYTVCRPDHWVFAGTGLRYGDALGLGSHIVAYETDGCEFTMEDGLPVPTGRDGTPADFTILATAPAHLLSNTPDNNEAIIPLSFDTSAVGDLEYTAEILLGDASPESTKRLASGHAVMGLFQRGGVVFNAGTTDWCYGLDNDPLVQRVTHNVLSKLGSGNG